MKLAYDTTESLPEILSEISYKDIKKAFPKPTLIHLSGIKSQPVFLSTCLHGNEDVGFETIKKLHAYLKTHSLPRSLSIFIGNVEAASLGLRRKDQQQDYNRIWCNNHSPEGRMAQDILQNMKDRQVFASIDLHNNT
ncbi:MAG: succinylglutamate desuccinylase/aspartoacylase family protein, partial [Bdellovibrionales bacterium]|nr:succinylglutamate desuccinylase/aspartoacylase family protein [Bdellovibrionales bacterium]